MILNNTMGYQLLLRTIRKSLFELLSMGLNKLKVKPSIDLIWEINYGKLGIACTRTL